LSDKINIFTDGSSLGNPGPGGYGIVMKYKKDKKVVSEGFRKTTNNRMELLAVIKALNLLNTFAEGKTIRIHTDSKYVINAIQLKWVFGWQKKGFKDKANADLWRQFLKIYPKYKLEFEWIKGHSGHPENEECDKLAKKAAEQKNLQPDIGYEAIQKNSNLFD
jgi:ribonuclease HI